MGDQDGAEGDWRRKVTFMRTRSALKDDGSAAAAAELFKKLGPKNLQAAAANPDHSGIGRRVAEGALKQKGVALEDWRVAAPSFLNATDLEAGEALFFNPKRLFRMWLGVLCVVMFVGVAGFVIASFVRGDGLDVAEIGWALALALVPMAGWAYLTARREKPARILLLRRFEARGETHALTRAVAQELAPFGHVIGFTERARRGFWAGPDLALLRLPNVFSVIMQCLGLPLALARRIWRRDGAGLGAVYDADGYRRMALRVDDKGDFNLITAMTGKETMLVRSNEAWRAMVMQFLRDSADAIVIDLSQIGEGTAWEFQVFGPESKIRCVFIARDDKADIARETLASAKIEYPCHAYGANGRMRDREGFRLDLLAAMRETHSA